MFDMQVIAAGHGGEEEVLEIPEVTQPPLYPAPVGDLRANSKLRHPATHRRGIAGIAGRQLTTFKLGQTYQGVRKFLDCPC